MDSGSSGSLVLLFTSLFAIPLARQCFLDATLFTGFQVVGVTFDFLDDVFLLNLPLKPAERIFKRLAFLYANLCQRGYTSQPAVWLLSGYGIFCDSANWRTNRLTTGWERPHRSRAKASIH